MQGADNATALNGGAQTANIYNALRRVPAGPGDVAGTSVQNELMTTREWQHAMYGRDRWQVNRKLTLDLGLRYEYYPLMQRADRGIEQVDLSNARRCMLGGLGGNPTDLGIKVSKTLFAPRLGAVYRINEDTRVPHGLRHHLQPAAVLAAAARLLPADAGRRLLRARSVRMGDHVRAGHSGRRRLRT